MRKLISLFTLLSFSLQAAVITDDKVIVGKKSSASAKEIVFDTNDGTANKKLSVDKVTKKLSATSDEILVGDGTASDKALTFNRGGSNAQLKWNETTDKLEFSNDGSTFKAIGSGTGSGGSGGINLASNISFEDAIGGSLTDWSNSGGTFSQQTYTNSNEGNTKYARFVASGAGQYFESTAKAIPDYFSGGCQADFKKYNTATASAFKIEAMNSAGSTIYATQTLAAGSWIKVPTISFQCPTAGTLIKVRVTSLSAATIEVDDAYIGSNQNLVNTIATNDTNWAPCTFSTLAWQGLGTITNNSLQCKREGGDLKMRGKWTNGTTSGSVVQIPLPSNFGAIVIDSTGAANEIQGQLFRSNDATSTEYAVIGTGGNSYFGLSALLYSGSGAASTPAIGTNFGTGLQYDAAGISIPIQGWSVIKQQDIAISPEQASWFIDVNIGGGNTGSTNTSSYVAFESSTWDMVINSGSASAKIPCASTNPATGLTCAAGNEQAGVVFTNALIGRHKVCVYGGGQKGNATSATVQLVETASNAQTIVQEGGSRVVVGDGSSGSQPFNVSHCSYFNFNTIAERAVKLMYEADNTVLSLYADRSAAYGQRDIRITIENVDFPQSRPILAAQTQNEIILQSSNSYGSSATTTQRWNNIIRNVGTALTLTQSATNGDTITVNEDGIYCSMYGAITTSTNYVAITVNASGSSSTDAIASLDTNNMLAVGLTGSSGGGASGCKWLSKNDVLRAQTEGTAQGALPDRARWIVTKMTP